VSAGLPAIDGTPSFLDDPGCTDSFYTAFGVVTGAINTHASSARRRT
jgi:hypothetical protein